MPDYSFPKQERLKSKKVIHRLFEDGNSVSSFPLRAFFLPNENLGIKIGFAVPKKKFRKAIDRNKIKRIMREAYRLQKHTLSKNDLQISIMVLYLGKDIPDFDKLLRQMGKLLKKISNHHISERTTNPAD